MSVLINYIIESSVSLGVLTCLYLLAIRQGQNLPIKRFYLLFALVFAAVLPLLNLHYSWMESPVEQLEQSGASNVLSTITVVAGEWNSFTDNGMPVAPQHNWITWFYGSGMLLLLIRFMVGLARLGLMRNLHASEKTGKFRLFITSGKYRPFSFFHLVFIPETLWNSPSGDIIFTHEKEHARQYHSIDILLLELVLMVQWFNPFAWMVRRQMKDNHEFMADRAVLKSGVKRADYLKSMMVQMMGPHFEMANNFSLSITQKRIKMMKINKIKEYMAAKISATFLVAAMLVFVFASETTIAQKQSATQEAQDVVVPVTRVETETPPPPPPPPASESETVPPPPPPPPIEEQVFKVVEHMPEFPGGQDSMMQYLRENVRYPRDAQVNQIQGRVYVIFVIDKKGKVKNVKINRSVDPLLDAEALRVVNAMPKWKPGIQRGEKVNVEYVLPINFVLTQPSDKEKKKSKYSYLSIELTKNTIKILNEKEEYTWDSGLVKIVQLIGTGEVNHLNLTTADDIASGNKLLESVNENLKGKFALEGTQAARVIYRTANKPIAAAKEEQKYLSDMVTGFIEKKNVTDANEQIEISKMDEETGFVFVVLNSAAKTGAFNKKLEKYVDKNSGKITYSFFRNVMKTKS